MSRRHKWTPVEGLTTTFHCERCGYVRQGRPHPYARRWYVEYSRDGKAVYDKAPPCDARLIDRTQD